MFSKYAFAAILLTLTGRSAVLGALVAINSHEKTAKTYYTDTSESAIMTWNEAMEFCQRNNFTPATIESVEENTLVFNSLNSTFATNKWFWLGATDFGQETKYYWLPSGKALNYTNWTSDSQIEYRPQYNCAIMDALTNGKWFSQYCHTDDDYWKPRPLCQLVDE